MDNKYQSYQFKTAEQLKREKEDASNKADAGNEKITEAVEDKITVVEEKIMSEPVKKVEPEVKAQAEPDEPVEVKSERKKILLVDDDKNFTSGLTRFLKANGYEAFALNQPTKTFIAIERCHPDLIMLDLRMPGVSGSYIAAKLASTPETKHIPVIILSGLISVYETGKHKKDAENHYLMAKTAEPEAWLEQVRDLIG